MKNELISKATERFEDYLEEYLNSFNSKLYWGNISSENVEKILGEFRKIPQPKVTSEIERIVNKLSNTSNAFDPEVDVEQQADIVFGAAYMSVFMDTHPVYASVNMDNIAVHRLRNNAFNSIGDYLLHRNNLRYSFPLRIKQINAIKEFYYKLFGTYELGRPIEVPKK